MHIYPTKKKRNSKIFPLSFPFNAKMLIVIKYQVFYQISPKLECGVDEYLCFPCVGTNTSRRTVNGFWKCLFNGTVYVEFRVCFAMTMYENDMFCDVRHPMHLLMLFAI